MMRNRTDLQSDQPWVQRDYFYSSLLLILNENFVLRVQSIPPSLSQNFLVLPWRASALATMVYIILYSELYSPI